MKINETAHRLLSDVFFSTPTVVDRAVAVFVFPLLPGVHAQQWAVSFVLRYLRSRSC